MKLKIKKAKLQKQVVMHAAISRKPLCKFTKKDPNEWGLGVYWSHPDGKYKKRINCKKCIAKMKEKK